MAHRLLIIGVILIGLCSCQGIENTRPAPTHTPVLVPDTLSIPTDTPAPVPDTPPKPTDTPTPVPTAQPAFPSEVTQKLLDEDEDCNAVQQRDTRLGAAIYTAYLVPCRVMSYLFVYERGEQDAADKGQLMLDLADAIICFDCGTRPDKNWQDVDADGLPDLIVGAGNNYYFYTYVYRMTAEGGMENILDACPFHEKERGLSIPSFQDIDGDGTLEVTATDIRWDYDTTDIATYQPGVTRVFAFQNCACRDVSASYSRLYGHTIDVFINNHEYIQSGGTLTQAGVFSAFDGLLACEITGRRAECWPLFWEMTDIEQHPLGAAAGTDAQPGDSDLKFEAWLLDKRAVLKKQFEAGLPFDPGSP